MTIAHIEAGSLTASLADRIVTGLLLPFGEVGRTNLGKFTIDGPGIITIPADISVLQANLEHDQMEPVARFLTITETSGGLVASFQIGKNPEGDALLAEIEDGGKTGKQKSLSAEVKNMVIKAGKAIAGALTGAAFVDKGAFPSARLMAADTVPEEVLEVADDETLQPELGEQQVIEDEYTDDDGIVYNRTITRTKTNVDGVVYIDDNTVLTPQDLEEDPEEETETTEVPTDAELKAAPAAVPATLRAGRSSKPATDTEYSANDVFQLIANAHRTQDRRLMAALDDVKITGAGTVGAATVVPQYVGELWSGRRFQRKIIPNLASAELTSTSVIGWRFTTKPVVGTWTGNKADVPTNTPVAEAYTVPLQRFAGAWDIAREFVDFGQTDVINALLGYAVDSYARQSDAYVLAAALTAAGTGTEVGTIPSGIAPSLVKLVDGALSVINNADALPTFALVASDVYRELALIQTNNALEFLSMSLGLEDGDLSGFRIIPSATMDAGDVLVGARDAIKVHELGGSPIRVNALDIARGGTDEAVFGYCAARVDDADGLARIINAA
jgi:hypothetical protein